MGIRMKGRFETLGCAAALLAAMCGATRAQEPPEMLDRVVAVVNNRAILWSDIIDALHLAALEPRSKDQEAPNARVALEQLISRMLIEQQIRQEEADAATPAEKDLQARLEELRKELPACVHMQCTTDAGWKAFLAANQLTEKQVEEYLRHRLEMLAFIERRFQQGIRISQEEVEAYYRDTLLPQYAKGEIAPPLKDVAPRIEEILLQEQVNALFGAWLDNLRKQGDVEILDPALEPAPTAPTANGAAR
jgi:peptidyl-prolyl cis-trans isomerase SurA